MDKTGVMKHDISGIRKLHHSTWHSQNDYIAECEFVACNMHAFFGIFVCGHDTPALSSWMVESFLISIKSCFAIWQI